MKKYWKTFLVAFAATFASSSFVSWLFGKWFDQSGFRWDTTSTTAVIVALILAYVLNKKK